MIFTGLGFCSSTRSLFVVPVSEALGVERSLYSFNDSFRYIATALVNIFFGSLISKFGAKKLICAGFISLTAAALLYSVATNLFIVYLGGFFLGIGFSWTGTTMVGYVVSKRCKENKGTIMGAVLAANGLGGALAVQIVSPIIEGAGYRNAYLTIAIIVFSVGMLIAFFFKDTQKEENEPKVTHKKKSRGKSWDGIETKMAIKMPYFYLACACIFTCGLVLQGITGIAAAHMRDVELSSTYISLVLSIHSIALAIFKFLSGFLYDRCGLRLTITVCAASGVTVMILLALVTNSPTGMVFAMLYGIFSALALPLETIMLPIYAADLFGEKSFNQILGIFVSVNTVGYALGGPLTNLCFDLVGSYKFALFIAAGLMLIVIVALQLVINSGNKYYRIEMKQSEAEITT